MVSRTGLYALQAVLWLARTRDDGPHAAATVAEALDIPPGYLAKTLARLGRDGVLTASRGARGGYELAVDPADLTLARVLEPFQELASGGPCLMGGACDPDRPCTAHTRWAAVTHSARRILERTTVADLLAGPAETLTLWTGTDA